MFQRSDRVKGVDLHPSEPWLLANLYNGSVHIWNYQDQTLVKSFEVTDLPVRTSKFIARKQWIAAGSDDMMVRVFNYNTMDKVSLGPSVTSSSGTERWGRDTYVPTPSFSSNTLSCVCACFLLLFVVNRSRCSRRTRITSDLLPYTQRSHSF